jgi:hypothetical protein
MHISHIKIHPNSYRDFRYETYGIYILFHTIYSVYFLADVIAEEEEIS